MTKCYKCHETCTSVGSFDEKFKCGLCKDYDGGFVNSNPFLSSHCDCRNVLCLECMQKKCHKCGSIKRKKAVNHCKYCKKEIRERIDNSDNDQNEESNNNDLENTNKNYLFKNNNDKI